MKAMSLRILRGLGVGLLFLTVAVCVALTVVPPFLDRIYYEGPQTSHYDGARFFNPDGEDTLRPPTGGSRGNFILRTLTGSDGRPEWRNQVEVTQSKPAARVEGDRMIATWIGHASVLVQTSGINILTDPIYSETAGPFGFGPRRVARPGVAFDDLPKIDLVLISHNHYDHMDLATLKKLWDRDKPIFITSLGNDTLMKQAGIPPVGSPDDARGVNAFDWGDKREMRVRCELPENALPDFRCPSRVTVIVTRNHHWGSRWGTDRNRALWSSFVVQLPGGNLFFAGDTGFGDGKWPAEAAAYGPIRLALIPIGAFRFVPGQMGTGSHIGPIQAVEVFKRLGARYAMPVHWGTFRLSFEAYDTPPKLLDRVMMCRGLSDFTAYPIGAPVDVPPIDAPRAVLPPVKRAASCDAHPFAPDLK